MKRIILLLVVICSLCGCGTLRQEKEEEPFESVNNTNVGYKYIVTPQMKEIRQAVVEILGERYWPDNLYTAEELAERTGISENMYDSFFAEYQHSQAGTDMMIIIEAKEDMLDTIEQNISDYRELLLKIYEQQPQNHAKAYASRIEVIDHYVCFIQLGADMNGYQEKQIDEMIALCQEDNERALDIIEKKILE